MSFDGGVVRFNFSGRGTGDEEDLDFLQPPANGPPAQGRFRLLRGMHQLLAAFLG